MRLQLEDQGDGWFPEYAGRPLQGRVIERVPSPTGEPFLKLEFDTPIELQERGGNMPSGLQVMNYSGAWVISRWLDCPIGAKEKVSAFLWLIECGKEAQEPPPVEKVRLHATCRVLPGGAP